MPPVHSPGSAPDVGAGPGSFRHFYIGEQPDEPWEDTAKIKAQIPHCYLLSLANSELCLPVISHLCTPPTCSPTIKVCVQFLRCSTFLHVSVSLYVLFSQPQRLFFLPAHLSGPRWRVTSPGKPSLRIPPDLVRCSLSSCALQHWAQSYFSHYLCPFSVCLFYYPVSSQKVLTCLKLLAWHHLIQ